MKTFYLVLAAVFFLQACAGEEPDEQTDGKVNVVCTTGMIADLVRHVGGERVRVEGLMGPGVDPHYYKASQGDISKLSKADLIAYNGLFLEGKMESIFSKMARSKKVVAVAGDLDENILRRPPEFNGHHDPHVWFDVALWAETIDVVVEALTEIDAAGAEVYRQNGKRYGVELQALHQWVLVQVALVPKGQRVLVTAHDAFGYFGRAYDIEVLGLQGISTVAEYGVNDVMRIVDLIVAKKVKAIFVESSVPVRSIEAVRQGCLDRGAKVTIGGTLYSDAMGAVGSGADSYVGMVRSNVNTIVEALK
jgi:manganese/zinc/iron transport system substrate-binding protein